MLRESPSSNEEVSDVILNNSWNVEVVKSEISQTSSSSSGVWKAEGKNGEDVPKPKPQNDVDPQGFTECQIGASAPSDLLSFLFLISPQESAVLTCQTP